jgi:hypothetical protein
VQHRTEDEAEHVQAMNSHHRPIGSRL